MDQIKLRYRYAEVAELLGISRAKVYRRIREGRLTPVFDGAQPFITHEEAMRYANTAQPILEEYAPKGGSNRGRPRKSASAAA